MWEGILRFQDNTLNQRRVERVSSPGLQLASAAQCLTNTPMHLVVAGLIPILRPAADQSTQDVDRRLQRKVSGRILSQHLPKIRAVLRYGQNGSIGDACQLFVGAM